MCVCDCLLLLNGKKTRAGLKLKLKEFKLEAVLLLGRMDDELPASMEAALARARSETSELRRMVEVQEAAMATAAARGHGGDAVAYAATLERWRQEVFRCAVRARVQTTSMPDQAAAAAAADAIRTAALAHQRARASDGRAAALEAACRDAVQRSTESEARRQACEELLRRERAGVVHVCRTAAQQLQRNSDQRETMLARTAAQVDEHASRLRRASDRIACAAELVRQKDIRVRNAQAALAAEKRLWRRERKDAESRALKEVGVLVPVQDSSALLGLRPEAEALMRGIFRALDTNSTGSVPASLLRKALRGDDRLDRLMRNYCGPDLWADVLDSLDRRLTTLSSKPWGVADCTVAADRPFADQEEVTWGEVLLFFVPGDAPDCSAVTLASRGSLLSSRDAFRPRLLLDGPSSSTEDGDLGALTPPQLRAEVARLSGDRGALLRALALSERDAARHRDDAALLWRHELRLRSLRADAAEREAAQAQAERDAAVTEGAQTQHRSTMAVQDARKSAQSAEERCAAKCSELATDLQDARQAMTRDVDAARRQARDADDALSKAVFEKDRALEVLRRRERDAEAQSRAVEIQNTAMTQERKRDEKRRKREVSKLRRERAALLSLARSRDRPQPSRRQLKAAPRLAELRALALGLLSDESTEGDASSSGPDEDKDASSSSLGSAAS